MIKKHLAALYVDDNIFHFNEDSGNIVFSCNEMGIASIDLNNINLDNTNYDEDDPETVIHIGVLAQDIKFEKGKSLKKELNEELMLTVWHPKRRWNFSEHEKKEIEAIFTKEYF